jgi:hypothetical protein
MIPLLIEKFQFFEQELCHKHIIQSNESYAYRCILLISNFN